MRLIGVFECRQCGHLSKKVVKRRQLAVCDGCHKRQAAFVSYAHPMSEFNQYGHQLTSMEIAGGAHRDFVGRGVWDDGQVLVDFLKSQGLVPSHRVLDIGCGPLRVGIPLLKEVSTSNYFGMDCNASLLDAARAEAREAGYAEVNLEEDSEFGFEIFEQRFDYALAVSVFTHLPAQWIVKCLKKLAPLLDGPLYATFFKAPKATLEPVTHRRMLGKELGLDDTFETYSDKDPYHYSVEELYALAALAGLEAFEVDRTQIEGDPVVFLHSQSMMAFCPAAKRWQPHPEFGSIWPWLPAGTDSADTGWESTGC